MVLPLTRPLGFDFKVFLLVLLYYFDKILYFGIFGGSVVWFGVE